MHRARIISKSKLTRGMQIMKYSIFTVNLLFLILGISLIVIGVILCIQFQGFSDFNGKTHISGVAGLLIALGILISIISLLGSGGMLRESRCMILTFAGFLVITFFCELVLVFIGFTFKDLMYTILQEDMVKSLNSSDSGVINSWNVLQREFKCCGYMSPSDWLKNDNLLPYSCCSKDIGCPSYDNPSFEEGCYETVKKWTSVNLSIIAGAALFISIVQIFGTTFSCLLARTIKKGYGNF